MEEIKSVRIRPTGERDSANFGERDVKVTLYEVSKRKYKGAYIPSGNSYPFFSPEYRKSSTEKELTDDYFIDKLVDFYNQSVSKVQLYSIVQNPWSDKMPLVRSFGYDPYYLNNGARVIISWTTIDGFSTGGDVWSDEFGNEKKTPTGDDSYNKFGITKTVTIFGEDGNRFMISSLDFHEYDFSVDEIKWGGGVDDTDILSMVIYRWKNKIPNYDLSLCPCSTDGFITYKSPLETENLPDNKVDNVEPEPPIKTDPVIVKEKLNVLVPDGVVKVGEDLSSLKIFLGEIPKEEMVSSSNSIDGFDFGEDEFNDLDLLSDEYQEEGFVGEDVTIVDGTSVMLFNTDELSRDDDSNYDSGSSETNTGDSVINTPSGSVSESTVVLPSDLKNVQNSIVITKKSLGKGKFKAINTDTIAPDGSKVLGKDISRNMNQFVKDVLGPFSTWLKSTHPNLYKKWYITSGTRGYVPKGGSLRSQHFKGQAIDSQILGSRAANPGKNIELLNAILEWYKDNKVGYGQILFETRGSSCWIHWSYSRSYNKLQLSRFKSDSTLRSASVNTIGKYVLPPVTSSALGFA